MAPLEGVEVISLLKWVVVVGVALGGASAAGALDLVEGWFSDSDAEASKRVELVRVIDGDTIAVRRGGGEVSVRLIGVDTPETERPGVGVECGGPKATASLERMVEPGEKVKLLVDPSQDRRDRYGRLLRYVETGGRDVGAAQLRRGHATVYVYGDGFQRLRTYQARASKARAGGAGVYGACGGDFHSDS